MRSFLFNFKVFKSKSTHKQRAKRYQKLAHSLQSVLIRQFYSASWILKYENVSNGVDKTTKYTRRKKYNTQQSTLGNHTLLTEITFQLVGENSRAMDFVLFDFFLLYATQHRLFLIEQNTNHTQYLLFSVVFFFSYICSISSLYVCMSVVFFFFNSLGVRFFFS